MALYDGEPIQYNQGGTTSSVPALQLNDYHFTKYAVTEAAKKKVFSQMATKTAIPKHYGTTIKLYREYPILDERNINDQGVDGNGLVMVRTKWYAWDASNVRTEHPTKAAALASAGQVRIQSGEGNLYGSSRDMVVQNGAFPFIGENTKKGGVYNRVGWTKDVLTAKMERFSFSVGYTRNAFDLDTDDQLAIKTAKKIGEAFGDIRESQIRNALIDQGSVNATYSGLATQVSEIDESSVVTYADLRSLQTQLDLARCPYDTTIITGSTKIGTAVIPAARYIYIPVEVESTIEDITHNGENKFTDVAEYADAGKVDTASAMSALGEIGKVGKFRFISVYDMPKYAGKGADVTDGVDANADGVEDTAEGFAHTDGKFDAFPLLVVGANSYRTISLAGEVAKVKHGKPMVIPNVDELGDNGSMAIEWWFGILFEKPEIIRTHICSAKVY